MKSIAAFFAAPTVPNGARAGTDFVPYKGRISLDAESYYCPYIPMTTMTKRVVEPIIGITTRYGSVTLNPGGEGLTEDQFLDHGDQEYSECQVAGHYH